jgi:ABC-type lipoprotein release transport system permease subunit
VSRDRGGSASVRVHVALGVGQILLGAGVAALFSFVSRDAAALAAVFVAFGLIELVRAFLARRGREPRVLRFGWPAALWALSAVLSYAVAPVCFELHEELPPAVASPSILGVFVFGTALSVFAASMVLSRASRVAQGTPGAVRLVVGSIASLMLVLAEVAFAVLVVVAAHARVSFDLSFALDTPGVSPLGTYLETLDTVAYANGLQGLLYTAYVVAAVAAVVQLGTLLASWFLAPARLREIVFYVVDGLVLTAFIFVLWTHDFVPSDGHPVREAATALSVATVFAIRAIFRLMPGLLDLIEHAGFRTLVAARMLRAKKSGFLTIIGFLSILAVSFSSCTLATTLSVMGGFRADLQQKILGNHAHVVIDREYGTFEGWGPILDRVREIDGVAGVTPYVAGEVMITSASNLAGAELRGIDPATIGDVTDLPRNMRHGRLEFLSDPAAMLDLTPDEMNGALLVPELLPSGDEHEDEHDLDIREHDAGLSRETDDPLLPLPSTGEGGVRADEPPRVEAEATELPPVPGAHASDDHASLMREIDEMLDAIDERQGGAPNLRELDSAREDPTATARQRIGSEVDEFLLPEALRDTVGHGGDGRDVLPGLIVGQELARSLRLHVGDEVNVVSPNGDLGPTGPVPRTRAFRVAGIFYSGMYEYDMQMAYTDLATAQRFLGAGGAVSGVEIAVDDWERAETYARQVATAIDRRELRVRSWQEVNRNLFGALELEKLAMFITLGIAILVASFCVVGTLTLMVQEKGREVAILKAMGAEDRVMVGVFLLQGLFIGVVGALSGLGLGYVACFAAQHFGIHMNPEVYYIDQLPVHIDPVEFLLVGVAAVLVCVLATIYPAILGSRLKPVDALRNL